MSSLEDKMKAKAESAPESGAKTSETPMDPETERHVRQMKFATSAAQLVIMICLGGFAAWGLIAATG